MESNLIDRIQITKLPVISSELGNVMHILKKSDNSFFNFGEVYISEIKFNKIKAWKQHQEMVMNLVVPFGKVKFVFYDILLDKFREEIIGHENYSRITVPPKIWFGFKGLSSNKNIIINVSNILHDPNEQLTTHQDKFKYDWSN